jgi:hypothetical protein
MAVLFGKDRKLPQAMEHALRAVEIDGRYAGDAELLTLADGALANRDAADLAERFFERVLDAEIAQYLVRSVVENGRPTAVVRRVHDLLVRRSLLESMPEWLRQPLRVVAAADCTARKAVLAEVLARPDARMAPYLRRFKAESGCGILGMQDCWSCERRAIRAALSAVNAAARSGSGTDAGG